MDFLFENAVVVTMDGEPLENGFVGVTGKKISYVGNTRPNEKAQRVVDCGGAIVMPGLIDAHSHVAMTAMRGFADDITLNDFLYTKTFPVEAKLDRRCISAAAMLGFAEMIRNGITTTSDMYFFLSETAVSALETGVNVNLCNGLVEFDGDGYVFENDRSYTDAMEILRDYHMANDGQVRLDASIHAEYTSGPKAWRCETELAEKYGLGMQIHISETEREQKDCVERWGKTPAEVLCEHGVFETRTAAAHGVWLTPEDIKLLASKGVSVVYNPTSNMKLASGIADVQGMLRAGIRVSLGTDGAASNNSYDMFAEMKTGALLQKVNNLDPTVLCAREALEMATKNGAYALSRENEKGRLREGFDADVIVVDTSSPSTSPMYDAYSLLCYSARGSDVKLTMSNGKLLYENGEYKTLDVEKTVAEMKNYVAPFVKGI